MALPHHDPEDAIRRANAEREATAMEFARLEATAARRDAQRARVIRDALFETPALADALQRRGVVGDDRELGKLASKLMRAPLRDAKPGEAGVHDIDGLLRDLHVARRGEFAGVVGELAARRQQLEARQRDLLRAAVLDLVRLWALTVLLLLLFDVVLVVDDKDGVAVHMLVRVGQGSLLGAVLGGDVDDLLIDLLVVAHIFSVVVLALHVLIILLVFAVHVAHAVSIVVRVHVLVLLLPVVVFVGR